MIGHRPNTTAGDLLRLLATWLVAILLVQGIAAAHALGAGPLHRHDDSASIHGGHHHEAVERHHHSPADADNVILTAAEPEFDATAFALLAAMSLLAWGSYGIHFERRRHVWRAGLTPNWHSIVPALLLRPPRQG